MKDNQEMKAITLRMTKELWRAVRKVAFDKEISVNTMIINHLEKLKNKLEKRVDE